MLHNCLNCKLKIPFCSNGVPPCRGGAASHQEYAIALGWQMIIRAITMVSKGCTGRKISTVETTASTNLSQILTNFMKMSNKHNQVRGEVIEPSSSEESQPQCLPEPTATPAFVPEVQSAFDSTSSSGVEALSPGGSSQKMLPGALKSSSHEPKKTRVKCTHSDNRLKVCLICFSKGSGPRGY